MSGRDPARVLVVCHANLCRSPIIERLARQALAKRLGDPVGGDQPSAWEVTSAGTHAVPGRDMHPYADEALRECGADVTDFATRRLTADLVTRADLILTAARPQRAACVTLVPSAVPRTFTLREFAHLAAAFPA